MHGDNAMTQRAVLEAQEQDAVQAQQALSGESEGRPNSRDKASAAEQ